MQLKSNAFTNIIYWCSVYHITMLLSDSRCTLSQVGETWCMLPNLTQVGFEQDGFTLQGQASACPCNNMCLIESDKQPKHNALKDNANVFTIACITLPYYFGQPMSAQSKWEKHDAWRSFAQAIILVPLPRHVPWKLFKSNRPPKRTAWRNIGLTPHKSCNRDI